MRRFLQRLANLFRPAAEREMQREIAAHLALIEEDFAKQGLPPAEARRAARRAYGDLEQSKELHREARTFAWLHELRRDISYGVRTLRQHPAFTLATLAVLTLGIGLTTAVFSIVDAVLLKPLPVRDADRLVGLGVENGGIMISSSPATHDHWRKQNDLFESFAVMSNSPHLANYTGGRFAEQWYELDVSRDFFDTVGFPLVIGRTFTEEEDSPKGPNAALIDEHLWRNSFAADPDIVGKTILLNDEEHTIIGVVAASPALKEFGNDPIQVYTAMRVPKNSTDQTMYFSVLALLKPGITIEQAKARLAATTATYLEHYKWTFDPGTHFSVIPAREIFVSDIRQLLYILFGSVCFVLLIACINVANLLLVRSTARRREIGIRLATGASRARIIRQLLTESLLLAVTGGLIGLWLGHTSLKLLLAAYDPQFMRLGEQGGALALDWRIALFTLGISILAGLLFGVWPSLQGSNVDLNSVIKDNGGRTGTGLRHNKSRSLLVICEVGFAVVLLVGSALLIRAFAALYQVERGFTTANVLTLNTIMTGDRHRTSAGFETTANQGIENLRALPGVVAATAGFGFPLADRQIGIPVQIANVSAPTEFLSVRLMPVSDSYFDVFQIALKSGRFINSRDTAAAPPIAIVNQAFVDKHLKNRDPLTARIAAGNNLIPEMGKDPLRQIVGVVTDIHDLGLRSQPIPTVYIPQSQVPDAFTARHLHGAAMAWAVRMRPGAPTPATLLRQRLRQATGLPVSEPQTMDHIVALSTARERFSAILMGVFGCGALLLAAIGVYGLMAYTVEQRTQEIGIRMALGADAASLRNMIVKQGMTLAILGVTAGLAGAWGLAQTLEAFLFNVTAHDTAVFTGIPALMLTISFLAVWIPTRRAMNVNPVEALRCD